MIICFKLFLFDFFWDTPGYARIMYPVIRKNRGRENSSQERLELAENLLDGAPVGAETSWKHDGDVEIFRGVPTGINFLEIEAPILQIEDNIFGGPPDEGGEIGNFDQFLRQALVLFCGRLCGGHNKLALLVHDETVVPAFREFVQDQF